MAAGHTDGLSRSRDVTDQIDDAALAPRRADRAAANDDPAAPPWKVEARWTMSCDPPQVEQEEELPTAQSAFARLHRSEGVRYLNRAAARGSSFNILEMNALALTEAINRVRDAQHGFHLFADRNEEAGRQTHREISRHVHNFLAAAKTLVDHTRVLMETHYDGTEIHAAYKERVTETLAKEPVVQFVHALRNYMLHKELPPTSMFLEFSRTSADATTHSLQTGVRLDLKPIAAWDRLTPGARKYLSDKAGQLDLHVFVGDYMMHVQRLHAWLDGQLAALHEADLAEAAVLQAQVVGPPAQPAPPPSSGAPDHADASETAAEVGADPLDRVAAHLLAGIRRLDLPPRAASGFDSCRPVRATFRDVDAVEPPVLTCGDAAGKPVVAFINRDGAPLGLDHDGIEGLLDIAAEHPVVRDKLGRDFVFRHFIAWARSAFEAARPDPFSTALTAASTEAVRNCRVLAAVAHLEVEASFTIGPVAIEPITRETIDSLRRIGDGVVGEQAAAVEQLFDGMDDELVGRAAVVLDVRAEPGLAAEKALRRAGDCIALMRIFSPGAGIAGAICPAALLGAEIVPKSKIIVSSPDQLQVSDAALAQAHVWQIPRAELEGLLQQGMDRVGRLLSADGLSPFENDLRCAMLTFSAGLTTSDPFVRLGQALSALEGVLLRHEMEPRETKVAHRTAILLQASPDTADDVSQSVVRGYALLRRTGVVMPTSHQNELFAILAFRCRSALLAALANMEVFPTRSAFLDAVDAAAFARA